ncbi:MAG TPA: hypothetical protein VGP43_03110 [Chitinophagaceae bacterium]|nr:hypothetical protein [Chitinophagaceae bacterium]
MTTQVRREKQADYTTRFGTVSYQNTLQLYGTSIGFDIGYKQILKGSWFVRPSIGFYKFSVDKITNYRIPARPNDPASYRPIDYRPDSTPLGYSTSKYHYKNFSLGIAVGKGFSLNKNFALTTDLNFTYLATFSQHYKIEKGYTTTNNKRLGYLVDYNVGVQKEFRNIYLASCLIIPIYKKWKNDAVFLENPNDKVDIWFGGYGLSFTVGKFLK